MQSGLNVGDVMYSDRNYSIASVISGELDLTKAEWIKTANDSREYTGAELASFKLLRRADVYIVHVDTITTKPAWLSSFADTGSDVVNNEPHTYSLYKKTYEKGDVVSLGENGSNGWGMYIVIVKSLELSQHQNGSHSIPVAINDTLTTNYIVAASIDVLANDTNLDDTPVTVSLVQMPANGSAIVNADNSITYDPEGFVGSESIIYKITDTDGDVATATINVVSECADCATNVVLNLSWDANPGDEIVQSYSVYFGEEAGSIQQIKNVNVNGASFNAYIDLNLKFGETACFKITAKNVLGESPSTAVICSSI